MLHAVDCGSQQATTGQRLGVQAVEPGCGMPVQEEVATTAHVPLIESQHTTEHGLGLQVVAAPCHAPPQLLCVVIMQPTGAGESESSTAGQQAPTGGQGLGVQV